MKEDFATFAEMNPILRKYTAGGIIEFVWQYQCPLWQWQLTQYVFNHQFIVLKTKSTYWSLEKNSDGITIQKNTSENKVKDVIRTHQRPKNIQLIRGAELHCNADFLIYWFENAEHLKKPYNIMSSNCKDFANELFELMTKYVE